MSFSHTCRPILWRSLSIDNDVTWLHFLLSLTLVLTISPRSSLPSSSDRSMTNLTRVTRRSNGSNNFAKASSVAVASPRLDKPSDRVGGWKGGYWPGEYQKDKPLTTELMARIPWWWVISEFTPGSHTRNSRGWSIVTVTVYGKQDWSARKSRLPIDGHIFAK